MMDFNLSEDCLNTISTFEEKVLAPLRVSTRRDFNIDKLSQMVGWAKSLDNLMTKLDPNQPRQVDRLFMALIDNIRLSHETLEPFLTLFFDSPKKLSDMKLCLCQREKMRKLLLLNFNVAKRHPVLRDFIRSDREPPQQQRNHLKCQTKVELYCTVIADVLPGLCSTNEQVKVLKEIMDLPVFDQGSAQRTLLATVSQLDNGQCIVEQLYENT
jgi:hypothetical protein